MEIHEEEEEEINKGLVYVRLWNTAGEEVGLCASVRVDTAERSGGEGKPKAGSIRKPPRVHTCTQPRTPTSWTQWCSQCCQRTQGLAGDTSKAHGHPVLPTGYLRRCLGLCTNHFP